MDTIYHLLDMPASRKKELVAALTTPEGFAGWWTSKTVQPEEKIFRFHFPGNYHKDFKVVSQQANHIAYKCIEATPEWIGTTISFDLAVDGERVQVHFRHSGWKEQTPLFGLCNHHWGLYMSRLKNFVETGQGKPTAVPE